MSSLATFAEEVISRLAWTSVQATLLIGLVWLVCRKLPQLGAATRSMLWWLLSVQLLLGLVVSTPVSLPLLSPAPAPAVIALANTPTTATFAAPSEHRISGFGQPGVAAPTALADTSREAKVTGDATGSLRWPSVLLALWLAGVLVQVVRAARQWREARAVVRHSQPLDDDALQAACAAQARAMGLRRCPALRVSHDISSPQVSGLWRSIVLLPARQSLSAEESALALAHELTHLCRGDLWMGWVPAIAQRLFFFHPLVGWAMREYALNREAACDAQVVREHHAAPQAYGRLLLRLGVAHPLVAGLAGASPTFNNLKRRLTMLQHDVAPMSRVRGWLLVILVAAAGLMPYRVTEAAADHASPTDTAAPAAATSAALPATPVQPAAAVPAAKPTPATKVVATPRPMPAAQPIPNEMTLPPSPPAPPPPPAPPAPRAPLPSAPPPLPPSASDLHARHVDIDIDSEAKNGFALFDNGAGTILVNGTDRDIDAAKRERKNNESLLWFRRGQQAYVIRDGATIERARAAYAPMHELAAMETRIAGAQSRLAGSQSRLASRQGVVAARMGELAARQGQLESQRTALESQRAVLETKPGVSAADVRQLDDQMRILDNQIKSMAERQRDADEDRDFERQQADIERQQAELERQQRAVELRQRSANTQADGQMDKLLDEAIAKGVAKPTSLH